MNNATTKWYPLRLKEGLRNYSFGNRWIVQEFEKTDLPKDHRISETWEVYDRPGDSSLILNGRLAGMTLRQAIDDDAAGLMGSAIVERFGMQFPLIIKFLDASNPLGEHMHPSDELVARKGLNDNSGKTEAWYMLRTKPRATILAGHKPGLTPQQFRQALIDDRSRACMQEYTAEIGDSFLLPAGTMHYSSGGVIFYEIMQNSDLNVSLKQNASIQDVEAWADAGVEATHFEDDFDCRTRPVSVAVGANTRTWLIVCSYFAVERLDLSEAYAMAMEGQRFRFLTAVEGRAVVESAGGAESLVSGNSCLLPANIGAVTITPEPAASLLVAYVPDLVEDVVQLLHEAGISDEDIRSLGGRSELNPLNQLS